MKSQGCGHLESNVVKIKSTQSTLGLGSSTGGDMGVFFAQVEEFSEIFFW